MTDNATKGRAPKKGYTIEEILRRRGIAKHPKFGDYQDYIEEMEKKLPTEVVYPQSVPVRGSVHLRQGRMDDLSDFWKRSKI